MRQPVVTREGHQPAARQCVRCLYRASHPFGLCFDTDGVCTGCITHREKFSLDWEARFRQLHRLIERHKRKNRNADYDCVVPIRGTPEYFYVLDIVKNRLGLNPLAVSYNSQFNSDVGIQNLDRIRDTFDVDILIYASNAAIYKKLIRESLTRFSNMRWPYIAGESVFPVQVAIERSISLIVWPYHQATEQVGMHSYSETAEMTRRNRAEFDLLGFEPEVLTSSETLLTPRDVWDLRYPSDKDLAKGRVRGIYLSNFVPWDSRRFSEEMITRFNALGANNPRTFDTYDRIDDMTYMGIHDVLKYYLNGYSRVTDNLCREIRFGRISREDALAVEAFYQAEYPEDAIRVFLDWLGMSYEAFVWFAERLPHFPTRSCTTELNKRQVLFTSGFCAHGPPVMKANAFTIYGKGMTL